MSSRSEFPTERVRAANEHAPREEGDYVLYWMIANRRARYNFALERAVAWCRDLRKPLVVLEALRCGYRWASDRLHRFVIQGMADNAERFDRRGVRYLAYVEPEPGSGRGLLEALAERACVVVTDDFPCFFLPRMVSAAAERIDVLLEEVDANGLYPMRATDHVFSRAYDFRRHLQKNLPPHLGVLPAKDPLARLRLPPAPTLPGKLLKRWPMRDATALRDLDLSALPIDHSVEAVAQVGGSVTGEALIERFLDQHLERYDHDRNKPEEEVTTGLSPYLHFGHVSSHDVFLRLTAREEWAPHRLGETTRGQREGWWNLSTSAEAFLDQLVTWRELGFNRCALRDDYADYDSLPGWALKTLAEHAGDPREHVYELEAFESARTHDPLWNAAQVQLVREGRIHNYLRMLWGKKILEWTANPRIALDVMIELNNKYALDGRNPNSYSGIFWVLGRFDRAWGPERPVFGKIRFMSSQNTARKVRVKAYLERYGATRSLFG